MPKKTSKKETTSKTPILKSYSIIALGKNEYRTVIYHIQDGLIVDVELGEISKSRPDVANEFQRIIFQQVVVPMVK